MPHSDTPLAKMTSRAAADGTPEQNLWARLRELC
jgi:hypothetical protein